MMTQCAGPRRNVATRFPPFFSSAGRAGAVSMHPDLKPGLRSRFAYKVSEEKTVPRLYTEFSEFQDMPPVFATAFMVGLIEGTCQKAILPYLDWPREQSVGTLVNFSH